MTPTCPLLHPHPSFRSHRNYSSPSALPKASLSAGFRPCRKPALSLVESPVGNKKRARGRLRPRSDSEWQPPLIVHQQAVDPAYPDPTPLLLSRDLVRPPLSAIPKTDLFFSVTPNSSLWASAAPNPAPPFTSIVGSNDSGRGSPRASPFPLVTSFLS